MNCKSCGYSLWNLRARACPECGTPFLPTQYRFVPDSVRFCCPHCMQEYYGRDESGLPTPRSFFCVSCKQRIELDQMVLSPAEGLPESATRVHQNPWYHGKAAGRSLAGRFFGTLGMSLGEPLRLGESIASANQPRSSIGYMLTWLAIIGSIEFAVSIGWTVLVSSGIGMPTRRSVWSSVTLWLIAQSFVLPVVFFFLGVCITHGLLRLLGKPSGTMARTLEACCLTYGVRVFVLVPCLGAVVATIYTIVSSSLTLAKAQAVNAWVCVAAVVVNQLFVLAVYVGGLALLAGPTGFWGTMLAGRGLASQMNRANCAVIQSSLNSYWTSNKAYPMHAGELLTWPPNSAPAFLLCSEPIVAEYELVGSATLSTLGALPASGMQAFVDEAVSDMPTDVVAHRVGEYVFTYHGVTGASQDPGLWLFVTSPSPTKVGSSFTVSSDRVAVCVDGSMVDIAGEDWEGELAKQNEIREAHHLAPLPDPDGVRHDWPARAGDDSLFDPPKDAGDGAPGDSTPADAEPTDPGVRTNDP